ncbi:Uncharacterised protein [BD1-7 clade bacterium]|uniref:Lipocalin-like domain-containing protein n=1 Tax=BD1-7 clade bacterium TaxID=2029982 RepID=A0A5S9PLG2_9GAMM|nr:Uncharacterised protein [BD1-7 clade bacterium]
MPNYTRFILALPVALAIAGCLPEDTVTPTPPDTSTPDLSEYQGAWKATTTQSSGGSPAQSVEEIIYVTVDESELFVRRCGESGRGTGYSLNEASGEFEAIEADPAALLPNIEFASGSSISLSLAANGVSISGSGAKFNSSTSVSVGTLYGAEVFSLEDLFPLPPPPTDPSSAEYVVDCYKLMIPNLNGAPPPDETPQRAFEFSGITAEDLRYHYIVGAENTSLKLNKVTGDAVTVRFDSSAPPMPNYSVSNYLESPTNYSAILYGSHSQVAEFHVSVFFDRPMP